MVRLDHSTGPLNFLPQGSMLKAGELTAIFKDEGPHRLGKPPDRVHPELDPHLYSEPPHSKKQPTKLSTLYMFSPRRYREELS